ncbi:MAG: heme exporter protein CcmB [Coriobacteriales bacterium]|nr:heme exporter protein CcmB [Coriobacteriales bacterium]
MTAKAKAPGGWQQYCALLGKDIRMELRTREMLVSMGVYAILVLTIYGAALSQTASSFDILSVAAGLMWALILFTSLLGLNRSFSHETENSSLEGILLTPVSRPLVFAAKATSNLIFLLAVEVIAVPLFFIFFMGQAELGSTTPLMILPIILGSIGIAGIGTFLSTLTLNTRGRDVLLAILMVPVVFPLLYACVSATSVALLGIEGQIEIFWRSLLLAGGYDVIMLAASWGLYEFVLGS